MSFQNIINEKLYLVIWFWYAFLVPFSIVTMFYRIVTIFFESVRFNLIYKTVTSNECTSFSPRFVTSSIKTSGHACSMS